MKKYLNPECSPKERAQDLLSKLSLEEKMAQTVSVYPNAIFMGRDSTEAVRDECKYGVGAISALEMRTLFDAESLAAYQRKMQDMVMEQSPHHIPAVFHMEGLTGGYFYDTTSFPNGINRGAAFDPELERQVGEIVSRQEKALGITQILAPVLDVARDPRMGRHGEAYGEDPTLVSAMGSAFARGIQEHERSDGLKADAVAKHFMGFHNSIGGIHGADSQTPPRLLREIYGKPFQAAIAESNMHGVMPCYCTFDGEAASTSKTMLTDILRTEMGFDGLAVSDYCGVENAHCVQGLFENLTEAGLAAMDAGMDMEWPKKSAYSDELMEWYRSGKADINILNTIVERILEAKFRMGLFENPYALCGQTLAEELHHEADEKICLRAAEESIILLKNNGVLPLKNNIKKIAMIGPHANNARAYFGGYTHVSMVEALNAMRCSIAGFDETGQMIYADYEKYPGTGVQVDNTEAFDEVIPKVKPDCRSIVEELTVQCPELEIRYAYGYPVAGTDETYFDDALTIAKEADLVILTLGGKWSNSSISTMGEGVDSVDINLPKCQEEFILKAKELGRPLVGIHFDGRPISSDASDAYLDAILEAFAPSEKAAEAVVNILTGKVNPSGRLPVSVAYSAGQVPIFYNHPMGSAYHQGKSIGFAEYVNCPHTPRYFFGFGLSYSEFEYSSLSIDQEEIGPFDNVCISLNVKNTSATAGCEVVQLYLKDTFASMVRPAMELHGFARVELQPGETKQVNFLVNASQMAFLTTDMKWKIEKGEIQVLIGKNAGDICLSGKYRINEDAFIKGRNRKFYADTFFGKKKP